MIAVQDLAVHVELQDLRYLGDGEGTAEPFLWVAFFKIDGDTAFVNEIQKLSGVATVVTPPEPRVHGNLPSVRPGERVTIQERLGSYRTVLRGIPMRVPLDRDSVSGTVGVAAALFEEDNTPDDAMAQGRAAFFNGLKRELDQLIPTLGMSHQKATPEEIGALSKRIKDTVKAVVESEVLAPTVVRFFVDPIGALASLDNDDELGSMTQTFDSDQLLSDGPVVLFRSEREVVDGKDMSKLRNDGEWEISGRIIAIPFSLRAFFAVTGLDPTEGVRRPLAKIPLDPFPNRPATRSVRLLFEKLI